VLTGAAERTGLVVRFEPARPDLVPTADGVRGALGVLLAWAFDAMREGSWERLKLCERHTCRWAFYDRSRNRSGKWCSMEVCGNRTKVEAYRERHGS
jgi:predicted RNA-binding Zn ribbon-like protein